MRNTFQALLIMVASFSMLGAVVTVITVVSNKKEQAHQQQQALIEMRELQMRLINDSHGRASIRPMPNDSDQYSTLSKPSS